MSMLSTIDEVVAAVGGVPAAVALVGAKASNAPSMWKIRGRIPPEHFFPFSEALRKVGKQADPALFGFDRAEKARA